MVVGVFLFPCCGGNRVVELSEWSTELSKRFRDVDFHCGGIVVLLVAPASRIKKCGGVEDACEVVSVCFELKDVGRRFAGVIGVAMRRFKMLAFCPFHLHGGSMDGSWEDDTDLSCGCKKCNREMESGTESGDTGFRYHECVPVFSREEIDCMVTMERCFGHVDESGEFGEKGEFLEYGMCGDVGRFLECCDPDEDDLCD